MKKTDRELLKQILLDRLNQRLILLGLSLLAALLGVLAPLYQKEFVDLLTGNKAPFLIPALQANSATEAIVFAFLSLFFAQACSSASFYIGMRESLIQQKKLASRLYQKTLQLKVDTMSSRPVGEIVSLYSTDVPGATVFLDQTLPAGASAFFPLLIAPLVLIQVFDTALFPTLVVMFLMASINTTLAFRQSRFFFRFKQLAGERIGLVNEWIQSLRTLRILGWVPEIESRIYHKRVAETDNRVAMVTNGQMMNSISSSVTFLLNITTLGTLVFFSNKQLTAGEILALLWILGVFLVRPFRQMPWFFTFAFDGWTSLKRLSLYLAVRNELTPAVDEPNESAKEPILSPSNKTSADNIIEVKNLNLSVRGRPILKNMTFQIGSGEFIAIVGEVGSGKSMLLLSLLRETGAWFSDYKIHGKSAKQMSDTELRSYFAFVPQENFIMSANLRDNVVFDYETPHSEDESVLSALHLSQFDLQRERVDNGLETTIGERGVNLSGGQRQRVSLARAYFRQAEVILLDDCLSAVDVNTEEALVRDLLNGQWKDKTRILSTHRLSVLAKVDRIFFLHEGQIVAIGNLHELMQRKDFQEFTLSVEKNLASKDKSQEGEGHV